jgi:amino acid adenylation domain-containing protein
MFVLQNTPMAKLELPGCTFHELPVESSVAKFDLTVSIWETADGLVGSWEYNTDLFNGSTIKRMATHFENLLSAIADNPQQTVSELPLLSLQERHQLLVEWNDTATAYPDDKCIHQLFESQVEKTPDAVAVVFADQQLTYEELNQKANQLANYLHSLGIKPALLVGICMESSLEMVLAILAILKAGGAYVPLDPMYPQKRLSFMLQDSQVSVLITQKHLIDRLPQHQVEIVCLDSDWELISQFPHHTPITECQATNLAYIIYTSGSTGQPKGVAVTHQAVNRLIFNTNYIQLTPDDRIAQAANIAFDAATFEIWGALLHGAKLVIITKSILLSPEEFAVNIHAEEISVLFLTTALFNQLANFVPQAFSSLRYLLFGGEAVELRWVKEILDKGAPQQLLHVYGPTENTTFSSWYLVEDLPTTATTIPIGRPISNTQIYLLDQNLQPVPIGIPGEIYLGGAGLAQGYFNRSTLTQEKFISHPFEKTGSRLYKTGDLARYLPDGNIEFLGRIDHQVKIRGFRIELGEIESVLNQHPQVFQSLVISHKDEDSSNQRLISYIVPNQEQTSSLSVHELRLFLQQNLPEYMIPTHFITLSALPLTPQGKIDRRTLPLPEQCIQQTQASKVAPRNELEQQLAEIWSKVLGVQSIGIRDNFFDLGGHSLLAVKLFMEIEQTFGKRLPIVVIFQVPTIEGIALAISQSESSISPMNQYISQLTSEENLKFLASITGRQGYRINPESLIVLLNHHGTKQPLVFCANALNEVLPLAKHLGSEQPVWFLESGYHALKENQEDKIKAIASHYVNELLSLLPSANYILGG